MSSDWDYFIWEQLADEEFRRDYEKCYAEDKDSFQIRVKELERKYGPIVSRNTIIEKRGDILSPNKTGHDVIICHQVNCLGIMGAGLAKQIREKFPCVYQMYNYFNQIGNLHGLEAFSDLSFSENCFHLISR